MSDIYTQVVQLGIGADRKNTQPVSDENPIPVKIIGGGGSGGAVTVSDGDNAALGATTEAAATTDAGAFSLLALVKRSLQNWTTLLTRMPTLGIKTAAESLSVAPASNAVFSVTLPPWPLAVSLPIPMAWDYDISEGESLSNFYTGQAAGLVGIGIPLNWTATPLTLQACFDGNGLEWFDVLNLDGTEYVIQCTPGKLSTISSPALYGYMFRLRSGTADTPVPQVNACTLKLMLVP